MPTQGYNNPTAAADAGGGGSNWQSLPDGLTSNDVYAECVVPSGGGFASNIIKFTGFGFSIPAGATIDGIEVEIDWWATNILEEDIIQLYKAGTLVGNNLSTSSTLPDSVETTSYKGGPTNLWGTTWTDADINNSTFGIGIRCINPSMKFPATVNIDVVRIRINYTLGSTSATATGIGTMTGVQSITL